jgi:hypothetical protein
MGAAHYSDTELLLDSDPEFSHSDPDMAMDPALIILDQ